MLALGYLKKKNRTIKKPLILRINCKIIQFIGTVAGGFSATGIDKGKS